MDGNEKSFEELWGESPLGRWGCGTPLYVAAIIGIVLMLASCTTQERAEYVDRVIVKTETQHDTLISNVHDSIYHTVFHKGDTVYETKYVERIKYRDRVIVKTDTFYRDSIYAQEKRTTVEKKVVPDWCYAALAACVLFLVIAFAKLIRWLQWH